MPSKTTIPFDPSAWVEAQRRNLEAFTSAGQIVADGMRAVAERQAAMVQDAMHELWGEMQNVGKGGARRSGPADQLDRMRHAFERVLGQVQEISNVLLKAQAEAMDILNRCASANMEAFGGMAPDIAKLQQGAVSAMQAATSQVTAAIEEMRRRMSELEGETRQATGGTVTAAGPPAAPRHHLRPQRHWSGQGQGLSARLLGRLTLARGAARARPSHVRAGVPSSTRPAGGLHIKHHVRCPPCRLIDGTLVPIGTVAYRWDVLAPGSIQHGITGEHLNLYRANQNPYNCRCFWQRINTVAPPPEPDWLPIQPFRR